MLKCSLKTVDSNLPKLGALRIETGTFVKEVYCFIETNSSGMCGDIWLIREDFFPWSKSLLCVEKDWKRG